jgi:hypothetical protein
MRSGFFSFFFLIPLGYCAAAYDVYTARKALFGAVAFNILLSAGLGLFFHAAAAALVRMLLYYTVMSAAFFWIMAPPVRGPAVLRVRTTYRFILGALAGTLTLFGIMYIPAQGAGFSALFRPQAEVISSLYIASSGADAVRRSVLESVVTPDRIMEILNIVALRGGVLASNLFLFFVCRQIALFLTWTIRRFRPAGQRFGGLQGFFVPPRSIWVLSFSLLAILVSRILKIGVPEAVAWNVLTVCVILFLAQGGGVALFMLSHRMMPPMMRFLLNVLMIILIFSPGINTVFLGGLVLLGIAENWVPFRAPKSDGTSSTPGM